MQSLPYGLCLAAGQYFVGGPKNAVTAFKNATKGVRTMADRSFVPTQEEISERAYEIYVSRGRKNGGDIDDWLAAEQELRERQSGSSQTKRPILLTGSTTERTAPPVEQSFQEALRVNAMRQKASRDNITRENATREDVLGDNTPRENVMLETSAAENIERENETHFKLKRYFSGSNP
jgi:Protein of unknown function (DUF2934)